MKKVKISLIATALMVAAITVGNFAFANPNEVTEEKDGICVLEPMTGYQRCQPLQLATQCRTSENPPPNTGDNPDCLPGR